MKRTFYFLVLALLSMAVNAQNFDKERNTEKSSLSDFRKSVREEFDTFRNEVMEEYINFVRNPWKEFVTTPPVEAPKDTVRPVVMPEGDRKKPVESKPVQVKKVVPPVKIAPKSKPMTRIEESVQPEEKFVNFSFFGTDAKVRFDVDDRVTLMGVDEDAIADALEAMSGESYNNMIIDCNELKKEFRLSDWAYLQLLDSLASRIYEDDINSVSLLCAYLYMNSGYKMRLARNEDRIYMLYASRYIIYEQNSYSVDGYRYYCLEELPTRLSICKASFEGEEPLSLMIAEEQKLAYNPSEPNRISSVGYSDFEVDVTVNKNLLDFYSTYPTSMFGDNMLTRWAMYANTPLDKKVAEKVYPELADKLKGLSQVEAVERLLNFVQTGFEYEYDDEVWGNDRIFFPDECFFYKYNDCDDRSVLFSRLVRDLLGLEVVLVVVPGHILAAVNFTESVKGGYVVYDDKEFVLCEPTCTNGAPVGWADIDSDDNLSVILLENDPQMKIYQNMINGDETDAAV